MDRIFIGVDAGGTTIRIRLVSPDAPETTLFADETPAAPNGGPEPARTAIRRGLSQIGQSPTRIHSVCAGITKITRGTVRTAWESTLADIAPQARIVVVPDYVIAFHGALTPPAGICVLAGTGSVVYGENPGGNAVRVGGRGGEWGDEGSGGWLTAEAIRRTLRALDHLEKPTRLTEMVCDTLGTTDAARLGEQARQRIDQDGRGFLVPVILALARQNDTEAANLFVGAAGWLAAYVRAAARQLCLENDRVPVATIGGLWAAGDLLRTPFQNVLMRFLPNAFVTDPEQPPVVGAVRLAVRQAPPGL